MHKKIIQNYEVTQGTIFRKQIKNPTVPKLNRTDFENKNQKILLLKIIFLTETNFSVVTQL